MLIFENVNDDKLFKKFKMNYYTLKQDQIQYAFKFILETDNSFMNKLVDSVVLLSYNINQLMGDIGLLFTLGFSKEQVLKIFNNKHNKGLTEKLDIKPEILYRTIDILERQIKFTVIFISSFEYRKVLFNLRKLNLQKISVKDFYAKVIYSFTKQKDGMFFVERAFTLLFNEFYKLSYYNKTELKLLNIHNTPILGNVLTKETAKKKVLYDYERTILPIYNCNNKIVYIPLIDETILHLSKDVKVEYADTKKFIELIKSGFFKKIKYEYSAIKLYTPDRIECKHIKSLLIIKKKNNKNTDIMKPYKNLEPYLGLYNLKNNSLLLIPVMEVLSSREYRLDFNFDDLKNFFKECPNPKNTKIIDPYDYYYNCIIENMYNCTSWEVILISCNLMPSMHYIAGAYALFIFPYFLILYNR